MRGYIREMHNERTWPLPEKEVHRENEAITVSSCSSEEVQSTVFLLGEIQLKEHGNEPNFPRFLHKSHWPRSLHFEPFRFWLQIRGDIHIRKTTPVSVNRGVDKITYSYKYFQIFK
jgi:hypothetical protein